MTAKAVPTVQIDNERVRVTERRFAPGAGTGFHVHGMDYVVVPSGNGRLKLVAPDGTCWHRPWKLGRARWLDPTYAWRWNADPLGDLAQVMSDASICGLAGRRQTRSNA